MRYLSGLGFALFSNLLLPTHAYAASLSHSGWSEPWTRYVAHAGGTAGGRGYTNSREALDASYARGYRLFEIDLSWTSDGHLVLMHDWEHVWPQFYSDSPEVPTLAGFRATESRLGLHQLTLTEFHAWLAEHPDAYAITDAKERSEDALSVLANSPAEVRSRIVPQVYSPGEYQVARNLKFERIVFTIYRSGMTSDAIIQFAETHDLWALTISENSARHSDFSSLLARGRPPVFVHTINDPEYWRELRAAGFHGVYTDVLFED